MNEPKVFWVIRRSVLCLFILLQVKFKKQRKHWNSRSRQSGLPSTFGEHSVHYTLIPGRELALEYFLRFRNMRICWRILLLSFMYRGNWTVWNGRSTCVPARIAKSGPGVSCYRAVGGKLECFPECCLYEKRKNRTARPHQQPGPLRYNPCFVPSRLTYMRAV